MPFSAMFLQPPGSTDDSKTCSTTKEEQNITEEHLQCLESNLVCKSCFERICEYLRVCHFFSPELFLGGTIVPSIQYTTSSNEGQLWVHWPWPRLHIICAHGRNRLRPAQGIDGGCKWTMSHRRTHYRDALSGIQ